MKWRHAKGLLSLTLDRVRHHQVHGLGLVDVVVRVRQAWRHHGLDGGHRCTWCHAGLHQWVGRWKKVGHLLDHCRSPEETQPACPPRNAMLAGTHVGAGSTVGEDLAVWAYPLTDAGGLAAVHADLNLLGALFALALLPTMRADGNAAAGLTPATATAVQADAGPATRDAGVLPTPVRTDAGPSTCSTLVALTLMDADPHAATVFAAALPTPMWARSTLAAGGAVLLNLRMLTYGHTILLVQRNGLRLHLSYARP